MQKEIVTVNVWRIGTVILAVLCGLMALTGLWMGARETQLKLTLNQIENDYTEEQVKQEVRERTDRRARKILVERCEVYERKIATLEQMVREFAAHQIHPIDLPDSPVDRWVLESREHHKRRVLADRALMGPVLYGLLGNAAENQPGVLEVFVNLTFPNIREEIDEAWSLNSSEVPQDPFTTTENR